MSLYSGKIASKNEGKTNTFLDTHSIKIHQLMSTTRNTKENTSDKRKVKEVNLDLHKGMESPEMVNI